VQSVLVALTGVLGLVVGSFLNVVIYRVPAGLSIVHPPSACPNCHHPIRYRDNVPLISWMILRGRCRDCGSPISARYPLIELATAVTFAAVTSISLIAWNENPEMSPGVFALELVAFLYLAAISIALAAIDLDVQRLPDVIVLPAYIVAGVLFTAAALVSADPSRLILTAIGGVSLFVAYFLMWFFKPGGMGYGDVKLAGVLGIYLGWLGLGNLFVGAFAPFLLGGLFAVTMMIARRAGMKSKIPFGPWMLLGAWVGISAGQPIFDLYLHAVGLS
jgi:leader peptidase (prepilin peptidase) / N-methyltransferase